jgi:hypothetical protein
MEQAVEERLRVWLRESDIMQLADEYADRIIDLCNVDLDTGRVYLDINVGELMWEECSSGERSQTLARRRRGRGPTGTGLLAPRYKSCQPRPTPQNGARKSEALEATARQQGDG